jgi:dTDP-4-amino-4,6-dideoxygalactose transaminase
MTTTESNPNEINRMVNQESPHFIWPEITNYTEDAVIAQMRKSISIYDRSGVIEELEKALENYYGKKHALLFNSGTMALYSMYLSSQISQGDEVICPAYTFYATVTPLLSIGAIPILVDCGYDGNVDPSKIESKITPKTKAIVITHMWGLPCEMDDILEISRRYNLLLLEDGSHAHGATYNNKLVGTFGNASAFSIQGQKTLTGGEGGFILTDDDEIYYRALLVGHYNKRCKQEIPKDHPLQKFAVTGIGLKLRIHPLAAAITLEQLKNIDVFLTGRRKIAKIMQELFGNVRGFKVPVVPDYVQPTWYAFIIQFDRSQFPNIDINKFYEMLHCEGCIEFDRPTSTCPLNNLPIFQEPYIVFPYYKNSFSYKFGEFTMAQKFYENALKLPVWYQDEKISLIESYARAFHKVNAKILNG